MCGLLRSPPFIPVYLCTSVGTPGTTRCSACPILCHSESGPLSLSVCECRATGSASGQTACPVRPTLRQSRSCHGNASPVRPSCPSPPLLPVWMSVFFLSPWCRTSLPFDFLSVLVVRGGTVCLLTPPSWFSSPNENILKINFLIKFHRDYYLCYIIHCLSLILNICYTIEINS